MGRVWISFVLAASALAAMPSIGAVPSAPDHATFEYGLGSHAVGDIQGTCDAAMVDMTALTARSLVLAGVSARLHVYETTVNSTHAGPIVQRDAEQAEHVVDVALPVSVSWAPDGRAVVVERSAVLPTAEGDLQASFASSDLRAEPAVSDLNGLPFWDARHGPPLWSLVGLPSARSVRLQESQVATEGSFAVFLQDAEVGNLTTGPSHEARDAGPTALAKRSDLYRHAVLDVVDGRVQVDAFDARVACRGLQARINGHLVAFEATGEIRRGPDAIPFARRELRIEGEFFLSESPREGAGGRLPVAATGVGAFHAVGLDFVPASWTDVGGGKLAAAAGVALVAGGLGLWKLAAMLFTRLKPDALLDRDGRRRVHEAVQANPGMSLAEIVTATSMSEGNARYHLRVLRRHGRIRSFKIASTWRFALIGVDGREARQRSLKENDPMLRRLLELLSTGPVAAKSLVEALQRESGLSRSGGWKVVDRAHEAQLVLKERQGKKVMVRSL